MWEGEGLVKHKLGFILEGGLQRIDSCNIGPTIDLYIIDSCYWSMFEAGPDEFRFLLPKLEVE